MAYNCNLRAYLMQRDYEESIENDIDLYNSGGKLFVPKPFLPTVDAGGWMVVLPSQWHYKGYIKHFSLFKITTPRDEGTH